MRGLYPNISPDAGLGGVCPEIDEEAGWLFCQHINYDALATDDDYWHGPLEFNIDPASGLSMPERGQWLEVIGSYDHPAARRCGDYVDDPAHAAGATLECRRQFVVTEVRVVSGP